MRSSLPLAARRKCSERRGSGPLCAGVLASIAAMRVEVFNHVIFQVRGRLATTSEIAKLKLLVRPIGRRRVHAL